MPKITKRIVDALAADPQADPDAESFVWDNELRGFGVRLRLRSGVASYLVQYRSAEGLTRRFALGRVGTLTPDEARKLAREKLSDVAKGLDPSAERKKLRDGMT